MKQGLIGVLAMALLWGCGNDPGAAGEAKQVSSAPAATATAVNAAAETEDSAETASARLASLVEAYFEENLELNPVSATFIGDRHEREKMGRRAREFVLAEHDISLWAQRMEELYRDLLAVQR